MTVRALKGFLEEISSMYPNDFPLSNYIIDQWFDKLKNCDIIDAKKYLENHRFGPLGQKPPTMNYFVTCYENSIKEKSTIKLYTCKYCRQNYKKHCDATKCKELCLRKKYIIKISSKLQINIEDVFETKDLTKEVIDKRYNRFLYKAYKRRNIPDALNSYEREGLVLIYEHVLKPKIIESKRKKNYGN